MSALDIEVVHKFLQVIDKSVAQQFLNKTKAVSSFLLLLKTTCVLIPRVSFADNFYL